MKQSFDHWLRKIIHVDMDAFFAAIEQRDRPELKGKPVIVGGDPKSRGVVSTASYEARKFGVHSAMSSAQAKKLCPHGIFLKPNFEKYVEASHLIRGVFHQHSDWVEPLSLDEAYIDVTQHKLGMNDPVLIATLMKQNIYAVTRLTASAGVAPNPFLAKVASDFKKPDGLTVVGPGNIEAFLEQLPVRKIPGVGPVTEKELHALGFFTCGQLAQVSKNYLVKAFGKTGIFLYERSRGIDHRIVVPNSPSKQYSTEETYAKDVVDKNFLKGRLKEIAETLFTDLKQEGRMGRTLVLKVKYFDFEQITRSKTLRHRPETSREVYDLACQLLDEKTNAGKKPVRLLGLGISGLDREEGAASLQKELF